MIAMEDKLLLKAEGISKRFGGVQALHEVDFEVRRGEVHALVGENGAGKTTLVNIIAGVHRRDEGRLFFVGREVEFFSPLESQQAGISVIHQELALMPHLSIMDNLFIGRMPSRGPFVDTLSILERSREILEPIAPHLDPRTLVGELSVSDQQLVEIAKALSLEASLIIMDEPSASLAQREVENLFGVIRRLQERGVSVVYVSHRMEEIFQIADRITVLRDGRYIGTVERDKTNVEEIIGMIVGRQVCGTPEPSGAALGPVALEVRDLSLESKLEDITFHLRQGEIVGFAGLVGSGRTEVALSIFGFLPYDRGEIYVDGQRVYIHSPYDALRYGLGLVPEDRKLLGLFTQMLVRENISMAILPHISPFGLINQKREREFSREYIERLSIRCPTMDVPVESLSGGNQQKVVIARWLSLKPKVLILDEPTHGIDVGAKVEICTLMRELAGEGVAIMFISSELPEILSMSDRIVVMSRGRIAAELTRQEASADLIMKYATGGM